MLPETLKVLTINDSLYYDSKGDPASDPKTVTHNSDGKKRKVTDTRNIDLQHKILINRTLLIITTTIDPRIPDRVKTCGGTTNALIMPTTKEVITDVARSSAHVLRTPGHVSRTGRDGTKPRNGYVVVRSPRDNGPVMIGATTVYPDCGIMGSLDILDKHGYTGSVEIRDTQKFDTLIDGELAEDGDSNTIFSKLIGQELSHGSRADIYSLFRMDFMSNVVKTEVPNFVNLGLTAVTASDEFSTFCNPADRVRSPTGPLVCAG